MLSIDNTRIKIFLVFINIENAHFVCLRAIGWAMENACMQYVHRAPVLDEAVNGSQREPPTLSHCLATH